MATCDRRDGPAVTESVKAVIEINYWDPYKDPNTALLQRHLRED